MDYLQTRRAENQKELIAYLESFCETQRVRWIKSLWIVDAVIFESSSGVIHDLRREFPDYSFRLDAYDNAIIMETIQTDVRNTHSGKQKVPPDSVVWNLELLDILRIWKRFGAYGDGILIGVFDSGINRWIPDISGNIFENPEEGEIFDGIDSDENGYIDDIWGYNFHDTISHPYDDKGHGTHVSGTIAGQLGTGIAPGAKLFAEKILSYSGSGLESNVWLAIEHAICLGVTIGNFSIGWRYSTEPDRPVWRDVMTTAITLGFVAVIAAGNEGNSDPPNNLRTPGDVPEVITVGAITEILERASFSSVGPVVWDDFPYPPGLVKPDIVAPGDAVISSVLPGGYENWDGTSMAAPHICAICALIRQINPDLTHYDIKAIIESTAVDLGDTGKDNEFGNGLVDIEAALLMAEEYCTLTYNSTIAGTLVAYPHLLKFYGDGDTICIPHSVEYLLFTVDGFTPETLFSFDCGTPLLFSPAPLLERHLRVGIMEFESGETISVFAAIAEDTVEIEGFSEIFIDEGNLPIHIFAVGYNEIYDTITAEDECFFVFLHKCIDFEDSANFSGTGDWEWGVPIAGPDSARSGDNVWATSLADTYSSSSDSWVSSPWFPVENSAALFLWQWLDCEATNWGFWDGGNVTVDFADSTTTLFPLDDYICRLDDYNAIMPWQPAFSGTLTGNFWHQKVFPIQVDEPCSVKIQLHFSSDDNTTRSGWYFDDFCVAKRTVREPLIRHVAVDSGIVVAAAYGVSAPIETAEIVYCGETFSIAMVQIACDSFATTLVGSAGDTVTFNIEITDENGAVAVYPEDSCLSAVIPDSKIIEYRDNKPNISLSIHIVESGISISARGEKLGIYDVTGKCLQNEKIAGKKDFIMVPPQSGLYFIVVSNERGQKSIEKQIFLK